MHYALHVFEMDELVLEPGMPSRRMFRDAAHVAASLREPHGLDTSWLSAPSSPGPAPSIYYFFFPWQEPPELPQWEPRLGGSFLNLFMLLFAANHLFEQYLNLRARRRLAVPGVPEAVRAAVPRLDDAQYARAREYSKAKVDFGFIADNIGFVTALAELYLSPLIWNGPSARIAAALGFSAEHEILRMALSFVLLLPFSLLTTLPLDYYRTFVIEG